MTTARDLIQGALRLLNVVNKAASIAADEARDGLVSLNDLIESWANDGMLCFARTWESFPLSAGTGTYTIGDGATFDTVRPVQIVSAYTQSGIGKYPLDIVPDEDFAFRIDVSGIPNALNYDNAFPTARIRLNPTPNSGLTLHLQSEKPLTAFANLTSDVELPPGWNRALRYNLALDLGPEYGVDPSELVVNGAVEAKALIKIAVLRQRPIKAPEDGAGYYDIYAGRYV